MSTPKPKSKSILNPEPFAVCLYSLNGRGKTMLAIQTAPLGLYLCRRGGLRAASTFLGFTPPYFRYAGMMDGLIKMLLEVDEHGLPEECSPDICLDDISIQARLQSEWDRKNRRSEYLTKAGKFQEQWFWGDQKKKLVAVTDVITRLLGRGYNIIVTAHDADPKVTVAYDDEDKAQRRAHGMDEEDFYRGGPALAAATHREFFCDPLTHVVRIVQAARPRFAWPMEFECRSGDEVRIYKDRGGTIDPDGAFPSLAEHLRFEDQVRRGLERPDPQGVCKRPPELSWMEDWVAWYADELDATDDDGKASENLDKQLTDVDPRLVRWVRHEGRARSAIRASWQKHLAD